MCQSAAHGIRETESLSVLQGFAVMGGNEPNETRVIPGREVFTDTTRPSCHRRSIVMRRKQKKTECLPKCVFLTDGVGKSF